MKKTMIVIVAFATLLLSLSAAVDERRVAAFGKQAPAVMIEQQDREFALESMKGKWVVLAFWSSTDPVSRVAQSKLASIVSSAEAVSCGSDVNGSEIELSTPAGSYTLLPRDKVEVLSVNLDSSKRMMQEIADIDNLPESSCSRLKSGTAASAVCDAFRMDNGLRTFVIDPAGRLAIADPDESTLERLLCRR